MYISDAVMSKFLHKIKQQRPRAIGLDIYRNLAVNPGHEDLVKLFKLTPNLIGIEKLLETPDSSLVKPSPILKQLQQVGGNDLPIDSDGKISQFPVEPKGIKYPIMIYEIGGIGGKYNL